MCISTTARTTTIGYCLVLIHICFAIIWLIAGSLYYTKVYFGPNLEFPYDLGKEHLGNCKPTTTNLNDLIIDKSLSSIQAKEVTETHGAAIVKQVLSEETTKSLREYIITANEKIESTFVLNPDNRFHIMPSHTEPTVQVAMKEIASHPILKPLIDNVLGPSSSLVAFSVITNLYGAEDQEWHYDTATSYASYPEYFVPEYTLAIPLQDTTSDMGATAICPGTHLCNFPDFSTTDDTDEELEDELTTRYENYVKEMEQQQQSEDEEEEGDDESSTTTTIIKEYDDWIMYNFPSYSCGGMTFESNAGDGLLYNADIFHRGTGHTNVTADDRVVAFLTFASSRSRQRSSSNDNDDDDDDDDTRSLPLGTVHSLHWKSWGHTIDDFLTVDTRPWKIWNCFGFSFSSFFSSFFSPSSSSSSSSSSTIRPWTLQDYFFLIFKHDNEAAHMISSTFDANYFSEQIVDVFVFYTVVATGIYVTVAPLVVLLLLIQFGRKQEQQQQRTVPRPIKEE